MNRKILIEKVESSPLSYSSESHDKFLGKLYGIAADSSTQTRNGRRYPIELWKNVESSTDFKEAMDTHTCFGECDHPFDDRIETSIKEIAIVLLEFKIENGKVYCTFGILDTPNGRLLKSILDSGCQIGISSRGLGEEVVRDGENIIDPDTYQFYGFDVVVMPSVVAARPTVVESVNIAKSSNKMLLSESFNREIESASTKPELESIMRIADTIDLPEVDSIKESINIKLKSFEGDDISTKLEGDLGNLASENEELKSRIVELEYSISAKDIRIASTKEAIHKNLSNSRSLSKMLQESKKRIAELEDSIYDSTVQISDLDSIKRSLDENNRNLISENKNLSKRYDKLISENRAIVTENRSLNTKLIPSLNKKIESLESTVSSTNESSKKLIESRDSKNTMLTSKLESANKQISTMLSNYLSVKCKSENLDISHVKEVLPESYTMSDIDKVVSDLSDRKRRFSKLPISIGSRKATLSESYVEDENAREIYKEDSQTLEILTNVNSK